MRILWAEMHYWSYAPAEVDTGLIRELTRCRDSTVGDGEGRG